MNKPFLSLIYLTYRPGGIDLLAESLQGQDSSLYELLIVDDFPGRPERTVVREYAKEKNIPLAWHGPSKLKSRPETPCGLLNAMNTGAMYARADRIVFVHDFCYLRNNAIQQWGRSFLENGTKAVISGVARRQTALPPARMDDISIWEPGKLALANVYERLEENWIPEVFENFYCGMHVNFLEECNGFDERADGDFAWMPWSIIDQIHLHRYRPVVDRELELIMVDHRQWQGGQQWHASRGGGEVKSRLEPGWVYWAPNNFCFKEERDKIING